MDVLQRDGLLFDGAQGEAVVDHQLVVDLVLGQSDEPAHLHRQRLGSNGFLRYSSARVLSFL